MLGSVGIFLLACPDRWEKLGFGTQLILVTLPVTWFGIWSPFLGSLSSTGDWDPTQNSFSKENMQFLGRFNRHWVGFVSLEAFRDTEVCWEGLGAANIPGFGIILEITRFKLVGFFPPKIGNIPLGDSSWKEIPDTLNFGPLLPRIWHFQAQILTPHSHTALAL